MSIKIKVGGAWRNVKDIKVKVNGVWRNVTKIFEKDLLTWKLVYNANGLDRTYAISNNMYNLNIQSLIGYDGVSASKPYNITITIDPGVVVGSASVGIPAVSSGTLPVGSVVTIINNGLIVGAGGTGGQGAIYNSSGAVVSVGNGGPGGDAIETSATIFIDNTNGFVFAGGGGGGGGAIGPTANIATGAISYNGAGGGGGGGGAGTANGPGGPGGYNYNSTTATAAYYGSPGMYGTTAGGLGGAGGTQPVLVGQYVTTSESIGGAGGAGGSYGEPGQSGLQGVAVGYAVGATTVGSGGPAGNSVLNILNGSVTWLGGNNAAQLKGPISNYIPIVFPSGYSSPCGSGVWTPALDLRSFINPGYLTPGRQIRVTTQLFGCTGWIQYPTLVGTFTYGVSGSVQSPTVAGKQFYMRIYYTANNTVQGYGFYSGSSTGSPNGQLYISKVEII